MPILVVTNTSCPLKLKGQRQLPLDLLPLSGRRRSFDIIEQTKLVSTQPRNCISGLTRLLAGQRSPLELIANGVSEAVINHLEASSRNSTANKWPRVSGAVSFAELPELADSKQTRLASLSDDRETRHAVIAPPAACAS